VSKRYYLREPRLIHRAARVLLASWLYEKKREFWPLRDIDIDLKAGQTLGVIGVNGSGKSTLLKLMAGVSAPTSGKVEIQGNVVGLLELGAGFHPDLTGYQNIYLQCNLMGLRKTEVDARLQQIQEFSGLNEALEWPVKRYSSGMYARLAFSVALHAGAEIILVDEILAVGDAEFQRRGINRMREIQERGESIIVLVTHDIVLARQFCTELIWLDQGRIVERGDPQEVSRRYWEHVLPAMLEASGHVNDEMLFERAKPSDAVRVVQARFEDASGQVVEAIPPGEPLALVMDLESEKEYKDIAFDVVLVAQNSPVAEMRSEDLAELLTIPAGKSQLVVQLSPQLLLNEAYSATVLIYSGADRCTCLGGMLRGPSVRIQSDQRAIFMVMQHPHEWRLEKLTRNE